MNKTNELILIPIMLCFFVMGSVDLVGIASNYVKEDLALSGSVVSILSSLVFFWSLIFSVLAEVLMDGIGCKKTVLLSLAVTSISLLSPVFSENFCVMLISFSLLGVGNALMQTSLNLLVSTVIKKSLAATPIFGQFVKVIALFMASYIAMWGALATIPASGSGWRIFFPIYMIAGAIVSLLSISTSIEEETGTLDADEGDTVTGRFSKAFGLFGTPTVPLSFVAIICHTGIDVGTNTTAPRILMERLGMTLNEAVLTTSLYFIFHTISCLIGNYFLRVMKSRAFFIISVVMMILAMPGLLVGTSKPIPCTAIALAGYGSSNIFSIVFSQALFSVSEEESTTNGLMIMGLFGGTVFPLLMGLANDTISQIGTVGVVIIGMAYLFTYVTQMKH